MKACFRCREVKDISEFYRHRMMGDGYLNKCKACTKSDSIKNRNRKIEYYREYDRGRGRRSVKIEFIKKYPGTSWAHQILNSAVGDGSIIKNPCSACGSIKSLAHHDNYSRPLEVVWFCQAHHREHHKKLKQMGIDVYKTLPIKVGRRWIPLNDNAR